MLPQGKLPIEIFDRSRVARRDAPHGRALRLPTDAQIEAFSDGDPLNFASRGLFDGSVVAGQSGAADVAHFGAVEAAGAVHRRAVVPHDEVVGPP